MLVNSSSLARFSIAANFEINVSIVFLYEVERDVYFWRNFWKIPGRFAAAMRLRLRNIFRACF